MARVRGLFQALAYNSKAAGTKLDEEGAANRPVAGEAICVGEVSVATWQDQVGGERKRGSVGAIVIATATAAKKTALLGSKTGG